MRERLPGREGEPSSAVGRALSVARSRGAVDHRLHPVVAAKIDPDSADGLKSPSLLFPRRPDSASIAVEAAFPPKSWTHRFFGFRGIPESFSRAIGSTSSWGGGRLASGAMPLAAA